MSIVIFLSCNGKGCDTLLPVDAEDVISARLEARRKGWDTTRRFDREKDRQVTEDHCKRHLPPRGTGNAPADIVARIPADKCRQGAECPAIQWAENKKHTPAQDAVFDWCGHDQLGHRMAKILLREGYEDVEQVVSATTAQVLDLRNFGRLCVERWEAFKEVHPRA